jgi:NAD(P)H-hydrate epimerase
MRRPIPILPTAWPPGYRPPRAVTTAEARALDRDAVEGFGLDSRLLMAHAAQGLAAVAALLAGPSDRIVVLCGPGNNGGDGYGAARFLAAWGRRPKVLRLAPAAPAGKDAAAEAALAARCLEVVDAWARPSAVPEALVGADLVIDAIFGTGSARVEGPYRGWIEAVNAADAIRLAADLPSGLDGDGRAAPAVAVRADVTATMGAPKRGLVAPSPGASFAGRVVVLDIGLPAPLLEPLLEEPGERPTAVSG